MSYPIRTIEIHEAALVQSKANLARRLDEQMDVSDCALSNWSDQSNRSYHELAIELLKSGLEITGEEIPYDSKWVLVDAEDKVVSLKTIRTRFDSVVWVIEDEALIESIGRKYIPFEYEGSRSRVQKKHGLKQTRMDLPVKPYFVAHCGFVGGIMTFKSLVDEEKVNKILAP